MDELLQERIKKAEVHNETSNTISIEEFSRLDIRTGKIVAAEPVRKSQKLLKLQVDIGNEVRQVIAGIAPFYKPEDLVGKDVVVVVNLQPARIFGLESQGMILAAGDAASLLVPSRDVPPGTKVR
jgi:methionyl-tRNA synthetase